MGSKMQTVMQTVKEFWADEKGATAIEYALIAGAIAIGIVSAVSVIGGKTSGSFNKASAGFP